jgi:hypothetical protein
MQSTKIIASVKRFQRLDTGTPTGRRKGGFITVG